MARIRSIKPDFFLDEDLAALSAQARLLFIGMWTLADRDGLLEDRPKRIKASLFPYDTTDVEPFLAELAAGAFIVRYEVDGVQVLSIPGFAKHQRPHPKETSFGLPPAPLPGPNTASLEETRQGVDTSRRVPVVVGCGSGSGSGSGPSERPGGLGASPGQLADDIAEVLRVNDPTWQWTAATEQQLAHVMAKPGASPPEILRRLRIAVVTKFPRFLRLRSLADNWDAYAQPAPGEAQGPPGKRRTLNPADYREGPVESLG